MYYSPLRYPGGKLKLFNYVSEILKINNLENCTYIEPYAGGAGLALGLLLEKKVDKIILNDFDKSIYSFWFSILNYKNEFIEKIIKCDITLQEWNEQRVIQIEKEKANVFDLGFSTFFLNRTNRSGIIKGGPIGGKTQVSNYKIDCRFNKEDLINRIEKIYKLKNKIFVYNLDASDFIRRIVNKQKKKALIFLDPPYFKKGPGLYTNFYEYEDHKIISEIIKKELKANWIVTYDNSPEIREMYKEKNIKEYSLNYSAYKQCKGSEIFIYDELKIPRSKLEDYI